jgi:hypothetical protein
MATNNQKSTNSSSDPKLRAMARAETAKAYLEKKYSKMKQVIAHRCFCLNEFFRIEMSLVTEEKL